VISYAYRSSTLPLENREGIYFIHLPQRDIETGRCIAAYQHSHVAFSTVSVPGTSGTVAAGTSAGEVILFKPRNFLMDRPFATPSRLYLFGEGNTSGRWSDDLTTVCTWCGKRIVPDARVLDAIQAITRNANLSPTQSPCLELPKEAWNEPQLLSDCPLCRKPLRFNPFVVDNRDMVT
jgi:hypothetical protein